jgi:Na+-driven multidrug efflux pump
LITVILAEAGIQWKMNEIQKADPVARRQALLLIVFATAIGSLLIAGFEHYREPFREWLTSEPAETASRAKLALYVAVLILCAPLIAFAAYLWLFGARVLRAQRFPPPGSRVIRDTPVVEGHGATTRGHVIQILAVCLGIGAALLWVFFWWLARMISDGAA